MIQLANNQFDSNLTVLNKPFFEVIDANENSVEGKCFKCGIIVKASKNVTSNFIRHLKVSIIKLKTKNTN